MIKAANKGQYKSKRRVDDGEIFVEFFCIAWHSAAFVDDLRVFTDDDKSAYDQRDGADSGIDPARRPAESASAKE